MTTLLQQCSPTTRGFLRRITGTLRARLGDSIRFDDARSLTAAIEAADETAYWVLVTLDDKRIGRLFVVAHNEGEEALADWSGIPALSAILTTLI